MLGPRLYLIGTDLYLIGTHLYLVGTDLYLNGTKLYLDFWGEILSPGSRAQDFISKIEIEMRAWIVGPKTLPHRH